MDIPYGTTTCISELLHNLTATNETNEDKIDKSLAVNTNTHSEYHLHLEEFHTF